jgi:serine phosphatase RsbU (regulator of sigma subunit)
VQGVPAKLRSNPDPSPSGRRGPLFRRPSRGTVIYAAVLAALWLLAYPIDVRFLSVTAKVFFWIGLWPFLFWMGWRLYNRLLWHVGGRLAFSYFLIGVVPIPLVLALFLIIAYGLTGFFLSRVFHETVREVERDLVLAALDGGDGPVAGLGPVATATYRDGERVAGDERAPDRWPTVLDAPETEAGGEAAEPPSSFWMTLPGGAFTLAVVPAGTGAGADDGERTLAFYDGDAEAVIRQRSGMWTAFSDETRNRAIRVRGVTIQIGDSGASGEGEDENDREEEEEEEEAAEEVPGEGPATPDDSEEARQTFFADRAEEAGSYADRAYFTWLTRAERPVVLGTGEPMQEGVGVFLQATPRMVGRSLFGTQAELVQGFWIALLVSSGLLLAIYAMAELVAISMIVGLSRAVSRLYGATQSVSAGDFSVRIPVRRRDQVGAVQRSFNTMAENLEDLVATAAQTELLEKELQIARQVQQSLIPQNLPAGERIEFSTLFEPSAAIGGDYFDVLRLSDDELAVVVADVSGHGLPTGLRMAMVKAALGILVVETHEADEILRRLDATVRSGASSGQASGEQSRFFVTAVFSRVDFRQGSVEITNAGHPPAYLLRGGAVEEILLPGSPLGGLGHHYGRRRLGLEDGDVLVWLSDGLIEASDTDDEPFGYDRTLEAIAGPAESAQEVRDRLLAAVEVHTGGRPAMDDRTLVVMRYTG